MYRFRGVLHAFCLWIVISFVFSGKIQQTYQSLLFYFHVSFENSIVCKIGDRNARDEFKVGEANSHMMLFTWAFQAI